MTPERWQQVKQVLGEAMSLQAAQRTSFLEKTCAGDSELRQEVESLLASYPATGDHLLDTPVFNLKNAARTPQPAPVQPGLRVGAYVLLAEIGRGGMGEVYRAVRADGHFKKEVALKVVRGGLNAAYVQERFRQERQILAGLDHPNIAHLLDGGATETGIPYLVIELVEGTPVDAYCEAKSLDVTQRLQLFLQVCGAVQFAHQRLVIHRDIKPGNVLVTEEGVPKLLDFGIAKILDASGEAEVTLLRPMTPEYSSPEQVRGEPLSTATDVYSLGVVLYRLLTAQSPYRAAAGGLHELSRVITETDPERPSVIVARANVPPNLSAAPPANSSPRGPTLPSTARLRRRLRGDLDNIVLKALRREPQRRYASVEQFAEDIRRHLAGLPVSAGRDSWSYRAGKFIRRNRASVAAAGLVLVTLVGALIAISREGRIAAREARIAEANRRRAEARFNDVRKLANSFMFEFHDAIQDLPGSTPARELVIKRALEYMDGLARDAGGDPSLQRELAVAYEKLGDFQGNQSYANLGDTLGALASYRKALALRSALPVEKPGEREAQLGVFSLYQKIGACQDATGDLPGAMANFQSALRISETYANRTNLPEDRDWYASSYFAIATHLVSQGDVEGALQNYRKSMSIREAAIASYPGNLKLLTHLAGDYSYAAHVLMMQGDLDQAIAMNRKALDILIQQTVADPGNATLQEFLSQGLFNQGILLEKKKEPTEALRNYRHAESILLDLSQHDRRNALTHRYLGFTSVHIGTLLVQKGDTSRGLAKLQKALAIFQSLQADSKNRYVQSGFADTYEGLGLAYTVLALKRNDSPAEQKLHWRAARGFYRSSQSIWLKMREQGALASEDARKLDPISAQIARCTAALAQP